MPVILGLEAKVMGVSRSGNFCQLSDQKDTNHPAEDRSLVSVELRFTLLKWALSIMRLPITYMIVKCFVPMRIKSFFIVIRKKKKKKEMMEKGICMVHFI
jgi:hypothetical protein